MLKIWGRKNSINVQKVLWCCGELGLDYERVDAGGEFGGTDTPAYRRMNPTGLIPTIDDDGFVLWESNSIVRYLAAKHSRGALSPEALTQRADAERWMDWDLGTLWVHFRPVFIGLVRTPPEQRDQTLLERERTKTIDAWQLLDRHLADRAFVTGEQFTMGDIPVGCAAHRWLNMDVDSPELPNVRRWYERLSQRQPYRDVVMLPVT